MTEDDLKNEFTPAPATTAIRNKSKETFARYASLGADDPISHLDPWSQLQVRAARWQAKAGKSVQPDHRMVLGICEEICELYAARGEPADLPTLDSVTDGSVFAMQRCTTLRLDYGTIVRSTDPYALRNGGDRFVIRLIERFTRLQLKHEQGSRGLGDPVLHELLFIERLQAMIQLHYHDLRRFCNDAPGYLDTVDRLFTLNVETRSGLSGDTILVK